MFELEELKIPGCFEITGKILKDHRGEFRKTSHRDFFQANGLIWSFAEQYYSSSHRNVIRGMHFQVPPYDHEKLVYCLNGEATDVILDLRKSSKSYGQFISIKLDPIRSHKIIYIPKGCAHGFVSHKDGTVLAYGVSSIYNQQYESGIHYTSFGFDWSIENPIISERDLSLTQFKDFHSPF